MAVDGDIALDPSGDIAIGADGDAVAVSGGEMVAQDIAEGCRIPLGSLPWAPGAGSEIPRYLNGPGRRDDDVLSELRRLAQADARIDAESIVAYVGRDGRYVLSFATLGAAAVTLAIGGIIVIAPSDRLLIAPSDRLLIAPGEYLAV